VIRSSHAACTPNAAAAKFASRMAAATSSPRSGVRIRAGAPTASVCGHEQPRGHLGPRVHQRADRDDRAGGDGRSVQNGRAGADIHRAVERAAEQGGVRPDEDVVTELDRPVGVTDRGGPQHRMLGDDTRLAHSDPRSLGVQHRAVHDAGPRANPDVTDQRGVGATNAVASTEGVLPRCLISMPTILVACPP